MSESVSQNTADLQVLLKRDWRMLIGGELVAARSGQTMTTTAPYDGSVLAEVPLAGADDVQAAVAAAQQAFPAWRDTPLTRRAALLRQLADRMRERARDFGLLD